MRLLNTDTLQFELIPDSRIGTHGYEYAILSHRWGRDEDEVSFTDVNESLDFTHKPGFAKIKGFCNEAAWSGYLYGWVDTCWHRQEQFDRIE